MMAELSAGLGSIKAAYDLAKGLNAAVTDVQMLQIKSDLLRLIGEAQSSLLTSQEAQFEQAHRIRSLETEIGELKQWNVRSEDYQLQDAGQGTMAYRYVGTGHPTQHAAWYCPTCFGDRKLTLLQPVKHPGLSETLECPRCQTRLFVRGRSDNVSRNR